MASQFTEGETWSSFSGCTCELLHHCLEPISHQSADLCRHFKVEEMKEFAI